MTKENKEEKKEIKKQLKLIEEIPAGRLAGLQTTAEVMSALGRKEGSVRSGGFVGYYRQIDGKAQIYALEKEREQKT